MKTIDKYLIGQKFVLSNLGRVEIVGFDTTYVRFRYYLVSDVMTVGGYKSMFRQWKDYCDRDLKNGTLKPI